MRVNERINLKGKLSTETSSGKKRAEVSMIVCLLNSATDRERICKQVQVHISFVSVFYSIANIFFVYLCSFYVQVNYSGVALWGTSYLALTLAVSNRCAFEDVENDVLCRPLFFHFLE